VLPNTEQIKFKILQGLMSLVYEKKDWSMIETLQVLGQRSAYKA
jgi:hypothetical protein